MKLIPKFLSLVARFDELSAAKRLAIRAGTLLATVGVAAVLLWELSGFGPAERSAQRHYDELEAMGVPLNLEDFVASFAVPPEQNCAPELVPLLSQLQKIQESWSYDSPAVFKYLRPNLTSSKDSGHWQTLDTLLQPHESVLAQVDKVVIKPRFVPEKDWGAGANALFPEFSGFRAAVNMSGYFAWSCARKGDTEGALFHLRRALILGEMAGHQPAYIGRLVQIACHAITIHNTRFCLNLDPSGANEYADILNNVTLVKETFFPKGEAFSAVTTVRGFNALQLVSFVSDPFADFMPEYEPQRAASGLPKDPFVKSMLGRTLSHYSRLIRAANDGETGGSFEFFSQESRRIDAELESSRSFDVNSLSKLMVSSYSLSGDQCRRLMAERSASQGLCRVLAYFFERGAWPATLSAAGDITLDPYSPSADSFRIKVTDEDVRVYSVGADGVDNGGRLKSEMIKLDPGYKGDGDLVAVYYVRQSDAP